MQAYKYIYTCINMLLGTYYCCNLGLNILRLFDVLPNFLSPQVKEIKIIGNENGIYKLPHDLLDDLRLRILGN